MICPKCHRRYGATDTHCAFDGAALTSERRINLAVANKTRHIGAILGNRFQIKGFIGQGGTSRLYLAEDLVTGEPVALKVLEPPWAHDRVARERFLQEADAARRIDHPGVAKIEFMGQRGDGTPYIAMEYFFGESLEEYLRRERTMDLDIALPVLRELTLTLEAAHRRDVIHRDVNPGNVILVGQPGDPYAVKLVDFGFAKLRDSTITVAGTAIGSVEFMAPEQCVTDTVDARTDVYGLGVVAYRMVTGRLPFDVQATDEALARHLLVAPPSPETVAPVDVRVAAVIMRCLRKDPAHRYADMAELRADLDVLSDGGVPAAQTRPPPKEDVYAPTGPFSRLVARALHRKLYLSSPSG